MLTLITRPGALAEPFYSELVVKGYQPHNEPIVEIAPVNWSTETLFGARALVVTSVNGALELARITDVPREMPIFAVGLATAAPLKAVGFLNVAHADGTAKDLLKLIRRKMQSASGPIIHIGGVHLSCDIAAALRLENYDAHRLVVYDAVANSALSAATKAHLRQGEIGAVVLMSVRTAQLFADLVNKSGLTHHLAQIEAFVMSAAIAGVLEKSDWRDIHIASAPSRAALIALLDHEAARIGL